MSTEQVYHYVYRITNVMLNKHYYGVRSSSVEPKEDLGKQYFSSSCDANFIKDQKDSPQNYRYKVVFICTSRKRANELEVNLHVKFNVAINPSFYNKANSTSSKFFYVSEGIDRYNAKLVNVYKSVSTQENILVAENVVLRKFCRDTKSTLNLSQGRLNATIHYEKTGKNPNHKGYFCVPLEEINNHTLTTNRYVYKNVYNVFYITKDFCILPLGKTEDLCSFSKVAGLKAKSLSDTQYHRSNADFCVKRLFVIEDKNLEKDLKRKSEELLIKVHNSHFLGNFIRHVDTEKESHINLLKSALTNV